MKQSLHVSREHTIKVRRFIQGLEVVIDGENLDTDYSRHWKRRVLDVSDGAVEGSCSPGRSSELREGTVEAPKRLALLVEGYELEPSEANLRSISKKLSGCRVKIQSLTRSYLVSDDSSLAADTHEILNEADKVMNRGQKCIRMLLRRLGVLPVRSGASSL